MQALGDEGARTAVAWLGHMVGRAGNDQASETRHGRSRRRTLKGLAIECTVTVTPEIADRERQIYLNFSGYSDLLRRAYKPKQFHRIVSDLGPILISIAEVF